MAANHDKSMTEDTLVLECWKNNTVLTVHLGEADFVLTIENVKETIRLFVTINWWYIALNLKVKN